MLTLPYVVTMSVTAELNAKETGRSSSFKNLRRLPIRSGSGFSAFSLLSRGSGDTSVNNNNPNRRFVTRRKSKDTLSSSINVERVQRRAERKKLQQALDKLQNEAGKELSQDEVIMLMSKELQRSSLSKKTISTTDDAGYGEDTRLGNGGLSYMERWFPRMAISNTIGINGKEGGSPEVSSLGLQSGTDLDDDNGQESEDESVFKPPEYIEFVVHQLIEI